MSDLTALEARLAASEDAIGDVLPHARKRIVWADGAQETRLAIVNVHGFSANAEEIRPVPDKVAAALGANLFFTRLTGHGRPGVAMGDATLAAWMDDMGEVMEFGRQIGERVILLTCSTGGTLAALAAADAESRRDIAGIVFVSPNFGLRNPLARLLTWPGVKTWGPWLVGRNRSFTPRSADHGRFWTLQYPTKAVFPMIDAVQAALRLDFEAIEVPALFLFSDDDRVVNPKVTRRVAGRWGGTTRVVPQELGQSDDPDHHVIAGEILSPSRTMPTVEQVVSWARDL